MNYNTDETVILLKTEGEYLDFVRWVADNYQKETILGDISHVEGFFGVQFGTDEQRDADEDYDVSNVIIKYPELQPQNYPCLFLTYSIHGMSYAGSKSQVVRYSDEAQYVYLKYFQEV